MATAGPLIANAFMGAAETVGIPAEYQAIASAAIGAAATSGMILYSASQLARQIDPRAPDKEIGISFTAQGGASSSGIRRDLGSDIDEVATLEQQFKENEEVEERAASNEAYEQALNAQIIELQIYKEKLENKTLEFHLQQQLLQDPFMGQPHLSLAHELDEANLQEELDKHLMELNKIVTKRAEYIKKMDQYKAQRNYSSLYYNQKRFRETNEEINKKEIQIEEMKKKYNIKGVGE